METEKISLSWYSYSI